MKNIAGSIIRLPSRQAAYVGEYKEGKREGYGYMILPDGGLYEGAFKADKFDGQVRWGPEV